MRDLRDLRDFLAALRPRLADFLEALRDFLADLRDFLEALRALRDFLPPLTPACLMRSAIDNPTGPTVTGTWCPSSGSG